MKEKEIQEIVACLPQGRTVFRYFKDRYALQLLEYAVGDGMPIREIQESRFARLLDKPVVKEVLRLAGGKILTAGHLATQWPKRYLSYRLTLGKWGGKTYRSYYQTTRSGQNLVLQLNFSNEHNKPYKNLIKPKDEHPFEYSHHPIAGGDERTLAWSRMDIDLTSGEALIEEIQNDWIRFALQNHTTIERIEADDEGVQRVIQEQFGMECRASELQTYIDEVLKPYARVWDEAILSAVLFFLVEELGIRRIFYHTAQSGYRLKAIYGNKPPASLYSTLPRRFCFEETTATPTFLERALRKRKSWTPQDRFFLLEV